MAGAHGFLFCIRDMGRSPSTHISEKSHSTIVGRAMYPPPPAHRLISNIFRHFSNLFNPDRR